MITLRPALEVGNIVVMENLSVHHFDGGEILEDFFSKYGNRTSLHARLLSRPEPRRNVL